MAQTNERSNCHCGRDRPYESCCKPLHEGVKMANDPESLMRSRFSAFKLGLIDYLIETHHPKFHWNDERKGLEDSCKNTSWETLRVFKSEVNPKQKNSGKVAFAANFTRKNTSQALCEYSNFICENGRWYYTDGAQAESENELAQLCGMSRNDPCWCGSGKKFKKCHLNK